MKKLLKTRWFLLVLAVTMGLGSAWAQAAARNASPRKIRYNKVRPTADPVAEPAAAEDRAQLACADKVVMLLARRDKLAPFITDHAVEIEPEGRIRVFFVFDRDMTEIIGKLGTFWQFPKGIAEGRLASCVGQGEPGFELHLDPNDPSRTVDFDAPKSSDIDDHEPAGDLQNFFQHFINLVQHKLFHQKEQTACSMLREMEKRHGPAPESKPAADRAVLVASR